MTAAVSKQETLAGTFFAVQDAKKTFQGTNGEMVETLAGVSFAARDGELLAVLGPSGCGKTTLLRVLARELALDGGTIDFSQSLGRGDTAVVWQENSLMAWKTALANVEFALLASGRPAGERRAMAREWIERVGLGEFAKAYPAELSEGMRKRVQLAAALAVRPKLLLADEPFAALDFETRMHIHELLLSLWAESGCTCLFITHDVHEAVALASRILVLTPRPARVREIIENPLPRPRDLRSLYGEAEFHAQVSRIWGCLR